MEHDDAVGERAHDVHLVLDEQDRLGRVLFEPRDEVEHDGNLVDAHARGRLVEHQDVGLERHHHRDLELALVAMRKRGGALRRAAGEADARERRSAPVDEIAPRHPRLRQLVMHARLGLRREAHVFDHAEIGEQIGELKRAPDAEPRALRRAELRDVGAVDEDGAARSRATGPTSG